MANDAKNGTPDNSDKVAGLEAQITTLLGKIEKLGNDMNSGLTGLRSMYDQRLARLQNDLKAAQGGGSYDKPYNRGADAGDQGNRGARDIDPQEELDRFERGRDRFERNHKDYSENPELKKRVDAIMADQNRRAEILVETDGRFNYERTYRTAYLEAKNQMAQEGEAAAAQARTQADIEKKQTKADAALSGDTTEELPEGLTLEAIENMSTDDMIKKGLVTGIKRHKPIVGV